MKKGFTTIELLVVMAIIALLVSMILVAFRDSRAKARDAKRIGDMNSYIRALAIYETDEGSYPTTAGILTINSPTEPGNLYDGLVTNKNLLPELLVDPANSGLKVYTYNSAGTSYTLTFCPETRVLRGYDPGSCPNTILSP